MLPFGFLRNHDLEKYLNETRYEYLGNHFCTAGSVSVSLGRIVLIRLSFFFNSDRLDNKFCFSRNSETFLRNNIPLGECTLEVSFLSNQVA